MKKKILALFAAILLAVVFVPAYASADLYFATNVGGQEYRWDPPAGSVGSVFQVGLNPFTVYKLGVFDWGGNGLIDSHPVAIFNADKSLLVSATVSAGTSATLDQGFRWVSLSSPVTLSANTQYAIAAYYPGTNDHMGSTATINPAFTITGSGYVDGLPTVGYPETPYIPLYGANMATPIPAAVWLLGTGLVGLFGIRRRFVS